MRGLLIAAVVFAAFPAYADFFSGGAPGLPIAGRIGAVNPYAVYIGTFAGASAVSANQWSMAVGTYALESFDGTAPENTAIGIGAAIAATTAGGITTVGTASCAGITTVGNITCVGSDAGRDYTSLIGGAITVGDQLKFTFTTTNGCNGTTIVTNCTSTTLVPPFNYTTASATYTVVGGDTLATIATNVAALIAAAPVKYVLADGIREDTHNLFSFGASIVDPTNHPTVIIQHFPSSWAVTTTYTCTGTCGETAAITPATTGGDNVIVGSYNMSWPGAVNPLSNVMLGNKILSNLAISPQFNVLLGSGIFPNAISPTYNVILGYNAAPACVNCSENVIIGSWAAQNLTGNNNTIVGDEAVAGQNCISTGFQNMELGYGSCVQSPTAAYQLSIQNILYGTGNSGSGATVSTGSIGIGQKAPGARLDILGTDAVSGTLAFRVQNSTPANLLTVNDAGGVTIGNAGAVAGSLIFANATSGTVTIAPPTGALGTPTLTLPTTTGTLALAPLSATSASIGGGALLAGACATTATTVTGATVGMVVVAIPNTYPGAGNLWNSYVSAANTVTTQICAIIAATPTASTYNLRILQ